MLGGQLNNVDFQTKNENHDFNQNLEEGLESINFRCPSCSKLYTSDPSRIYVEEPEYTCSSCDMEFSISLLQALENSEVVGNPILHVYEEDTAPAQVELPKKTNSTAKTVELLQQEFDFDKLEEGSVSFSELVEDDLNGPFEEKWAAVLDDYESRQAHNKFINYCKTEKNLDYAIERYAKIVEINPSDRLASSFLKKIEFTVDTRMKLNSIKDSGLFSRSFYITLGVVLCGLLMIAIGSLWFQNKNIAGLGIGLVFFTFAAKAFFQPRTFGE